MCASSSGPWRSSDYVSLTTVHTAELGLAAMRSHGARSHPRSISATRICVRRDSHRRLMAMADERNIAILDLSANQAFGRGLSRRRVAAGAELIDIPRLLSEIERRIAILG